MKARIIILNYNGEAMLRKCLPSVLIAIKNSRHEVALTVLDNGSTDGSERLVRDEFPTAEYVHAPSNDFLCSFNGYAQSIQDEAMFLLNNDLKLAEGFCDPLIDCMESDPAIFFCAPKSMTFDGAEYEGSLSKCEIKKGLIWGSARFAGHESLIDQDSVTMQCGFGLFRREYFLQLGGYDDLYLPGTMEDTDLCFRGYLSGWRGVYCHKSICFHMGQASFGKAFGNAGIRRINRRNRHLFMWKNIRSIRIWFAYLIWTPIHLIHQLITGAYSDLLGFSDAFRRLPIVVQKRRNDRSNACKLRDRDVFNLSKNIGI